jgi:hypothetical protein
MEHFFFINSEFGAGFKPELRVHSGEEHLVFPVIAAKVGVMNNVFYSKDVLEKSASLWNGTAVTVTHPKNNNENTSVRSPAMSEKFEVGKFFNVNFEDDALKGQIWLNKKYMASKGYQDVLEKLENGEVIDVSTGLLAFTNSKKGVYNNKKYDKEISGMFPDHLAILPNEAGACSIKDGCGTMRVNALSFSDIHRKLHEAIGGYDAKKYICDIYEKYFIFEDGEKYFYQEYIILDEKVTLGEQKEVVRSVVYKDALTKEILVNDSKVFDNLNNCCDECKKDLQKIQNSIIVNNKKHGGVMKQTAINFIANSGVDFADAEKEALNNISDVNLVRMLEGLKVNKEQIVISKEDNQILLNHKQELKTQEQVLRTELKALYNSLDDNTIQSLEINAVKQLIAEKKDKTPAPNFIGNGGGGGTPNGAYHYNSFDALKKGDGANA